jgi:hypothetical protein
VLQARLLLCGSGVYGTRAHHLRAHQAHIVSAAHCYAHGMTTEPLQASTTRDEMLKAPTVVCWETLLLHY